MNFDATLQIFNKMQKVYMDCIKETLRRALYVRWGNDWFEKLKELDVENARKNYKASKILKRYTSIDELDFQACNKVLAYLPEVREVVFAYCEVVEKKEVYVAKIKELINFRNEFQGHNSFSDEDSNDTQDSYAKAVENMHFILKNVFGDIVDKRDSQSRKYLAQFEDEKAGYYLDVLKKVYILSDYLNSEEYDYKQFFEKSELLGIENGIENGKYVFYSSNLESDLSRLKNALAFNNDISLSGQYQQDKITKILSKKVLYAVTMFTIVLCVGVVGIILWGLGAGEDTIVNDSGTNGIQDEQMIDKPLDNTNSQQDEQHIQIENTDSSNENVGAISNPNDFQNNDTNEGENEQVLVKQGINEIPAKYEKEVEEFKYQQEGFINLQTLNISVGEFVTPMAASTWSGCTIYSQNTAIAKAEGSIIEGISPGTVYVIVESSLGLTQVYKVVVE